MGKKQLHGAADREVQKKLKISVKVRDNIIVEIRSYCAILKMIEPPYCKLPGLRNEESKQYRGSIEPISAHILSTTGMSASGTRKYTTAELLLSIVDAYPPTELSQ